MSKVVMVGGPAHGQTLDIPENRNAITFVEPQQVSPPVMTAQGMKFADMPYKEHIYELRKLVSSKQYGPQKAYEFLLHEDLTKLESRLNIESACLDAMMRAFL